MLDQEIKWLPAVRKPWEDSEKASQSFRRNDNFPYLSSSL